MNNQLQRVLLGLFVLALYVAHQDVWFWRTARPFFLGFLPVGLTYHVVFTLLVSVLMGLLVRIAWPSHLEAQTDPDAKEDTLR